MADLGTLSSPAHSCCSRPLIRVARTDLGTEHLRALGDFRFTLGYVHGALQRRTYPCTLTVEIVEADKAAIARKHNASLRSPISASLAGDDLGEDDLPPAKPWTASLPPPDVTPTVLTGLPSPSDPPLKPGWYTFDLTKKGVFFLYGGKVPLIARDVRRGTISTTDRLTLL